MPRTPFEFDKLSAGQVVGDEVPWQVAPAETGLEQVAFGTEVVDQPLALAGNALLGPFRAGLVAGDDDLDVSAIRVNVLSPGPTATELAKAAVSEEGMQVLASMNPLRRMAEPVEIGAAAAFLASQDSSFMTVSELAVDGGLAQI